MMDTHERFLAKIEYKEDDDCWLWNAADNGRGYGVFFWNGKLGYAHRYSWEYINGEITEGLEIDHLCRVRNCVNPDHLEAVTPLENIRRRPDVNKEFCLNGHKMTEENTDTHSGWRQCRICVRESAIRRARERGVREMGTFKPWNTKLTQEQVDEIKEKYIPRVYPQSKLAEEYGVCQTVISEIITGKSWKTKDES